MHPNWLLPEFVDDVLPQEAQNIERVRRRVLDLFASCGYELVSPPLIEYIESLLTGSAKDLDLQTFKLVDQISGKTLGIRADITPQIARIDAHLLRGEGVSRLCYADRVLRTQPEQGGMSRELVQLGAELFGCSEIVADIEINRLMVQSVREVVVSPLTLDLGTVAIAQAVSSWLNLSEESKVQYYRGLQLKDSDMLEDFSREFNDDARAVVMALPKMYGDHTVIERGRDVLASVPGAKQRLDELEMVYNAVKGYVSHVSFDLAELRGFEYHSGLVAAVYVEGQTSPIARGGRYDHVGQAFGKARPATGFTLDLRRLTQCSSFSGAANSVKKVWAPSSDNDAKLLSKISSLRQSGDVVIEDLSGSTEDLIGSQYTHKLVKSASGWSLVVIDRSIDR
jgi:ATP phosphoribosyltransferase regulatory subunit